jgi:hypothetical protein
MDDVLTRLDKLEKENRRLKRGGIATFILIATAGLMGQVQSNRVVVAQKYELRDVSGVRQAELSMLNGRPALQLLNNGKPAATLTGAEISTLMLAGYTGMNFVSPNGIFVSAGSQGASLLAGNEGATLSVSTSSGGASNQIGLTTTQEYSFVEIIDKGKFRANIGTEDLITPATGEKHRTSAAAIRMFNEKGNVIWSAP